jgi:nicotinamidase/pyrazinamidase
MSKKLVVVVDAQNDFMKESGALYVNGSQDLIDNINTFLRNLDSKEVSNVLFTFDTHNAEVYSASDEGKMFPPHCIEGTTGHALAVDATLVPDGIRVATLTKGVFDMWAEDNVVVNTPTASVNVVPREVFFQELKLQADITEVVVVGVALNVCVKYAVLGLVQRGFKVIVPAVLTKGIDIGNGNKDTDPALVFETEITQGRLQVR